jgi:hypothetical protein
MAGRERQRQYRNIKEKLQVRIAKGSPVFEACEHSQVIQKYPKHR